MKSFSEGIDHILSVDSVERSSKRQPSSIAVDRAGGNAHLCASQVRRGDIGSTEPVVVVSRRRFLITAGAGLGLLLVDGPLSRASSANKRVRVGFVMPASGPDLGEADSLMAGFQATRVNSRPFRDIATGFKWPALTTLAGADFRC